MVRRTRIDLLAIAFLGEYWQSTGVNAAYVKLAVGKALVSVCKSSERRGLAILIPHGFLNLLDNVKGTDERLRTSLT